MTAIEASVGLKTDHRKGMVPKAPQKAVGNGRGGGKDRGGFDFGDDYLLKLEIYDESDLPCVRYVAKAKFLQDVMVETDARAIATRFYPIGKGA